MRILVCAVFAVLAPTAGFAAAFDVSLDDINGQRVLVVARSGGGAAGVASGGEDLTVLRGEAADRAIASLTEVEATKLGGAEENGAAKGKARKRKIVIHKMDFDEDESGGSEKEVRIIRKTDGQRREEALLSGDEDFLIEGEPAANAVERRIIRLKGVDESRAIKFIDETPGLDVGERAEMKKAAGL
jgi:hypothetical protein